MAFLEKWRRKYLQLVWSSLVAISIIVILISVVHILVTWVFILTFLICNMVVSVFIQLYLNVNSPGASILSQDTLMLIQHRFIASLMSFRLLAIWNLNKEFLTFILVSAVCVEKFVIELNCSYIINKGQHCCCLVEFSLHMLNVGYTVLSCWVSWTRNPKHTCILLQKVDAFCRSMCIVY